MEDIEKDFKEKICTFCIYYQDEKCKNTQKIITNNLTIYKCLNYKRRRKNMNSSQNANRIMFDYYKKKRYENNKKTTELNNFKRKNCIDCKNKNSNLCHIQKNINNELQCVYKK